VRFTNFSSADPVCSPSRAALLTGRYPTRVGVPHVFFPQDKGGMNLDEVTLANVLKNRGYRTICIGKWHLGRPVEYLPTSRGFDEYFGIPYSNDMNPRVLMHNTEVIEQETDLSTLTPRYTEQAVRFVRENSGSPMFLFLPQTYPHIPLGASERFRGKSPEGLYGDVVQEIDWSVGEIRRALKENSLEQNTLTVTRREALEIERIARVNGVDKGGEAHNRLMEWLNHRPTDHFFQVCRRGVKLMLHDRSPIEARSLRRDLIKYCTRIAKMSGVFLSSVSGVSPEEERTLNDLMREFGRAIG
jgi:hypothetical protein